MSRRNQIWLAVIVVAGVGAGLLLGVGWGFAAAGVVLVLSEVVERIRRVRRARAGGAAAPSAFDTISARRRKR